MKNVKRYHEDKILYYEGMLNENEKNVENGKIGNMEYYQNARKKALNGIEKHTIYLKELRKNEV